MKLTRKQLKRIVKEEIQRVMNEERPMEDEEVSPDWKSGEALIKPIVQMTSMFMKKVSALESDDWEERQRAYKAYSIPISGKIREIIAMTKRTSLSQTFYRGMFSGLTDGYEMLQKIPGYVEIPDEYSTFRDYINGKTGYT